MFKKLNVLSIIFGWAFFTSIGAVVVNLNDSIYLTFKKNIYEALENKNKFSIDHILRVVTECVVLFRTRAATLSGIGKGDDLQAMEKLKAYYRDFYYTDLFLKAFNVDPTLFYMLLANSKLPNSHLKLIPFFNKFLAEIFKEYCEKGKAILSENIKNNDTDKIPKSPQDLFKPMAEKLIDPITTYNEYAKADPELLKISADDQKQISLYLKTKYFNCVILSPIKTALSTNNIPALKIMIEQFFKFFNDFKNNDVIDILQACLHNSSLNPLLDAPLETWIRYSIDSIKTADILKDLNSIGFSKDILISTIKEVIDADLKNNKPGFKSILKDPKNLTKVIDKIRQFDPGFDLSDTTKNSNLNDQINALTNLNATLNFLSNLGKT